MRIFAVLLRVRPNLLFDQGMWQVSPNNDNCHRETYMHLNHDYICFFCAGSELFFHKLIVCNNRKCEDMRNFAVYGFLLFCYEIKWSLQKFKKFKTYIATHKVMVPGSQKLFAIVSSHLKPFPVD